MKNKKKTGYREVLGYKDYTKLFYANIVNRFGDSIDAIAFTWMVYQLTGSASWSAVIFGINKVPTIFLQPIAGAHVERHNKKRIMVWMDVIRGLCVAFVSISFFLNVLNPWILIITSLLISSAEAYRLPSSSAMLVRILPKEIIDFGVSLNSSVSTIIELAGTAVAGVIISLFGLPFAIGVDAATFLVSAFIISFMRTGKEIIEENEKKIGYMQLLKGGCKYVLSERTVRNFIILAVIVNAMFVPMNSLQAPLVSEVLKSDENMLSILSLSLSAGMLLSTFVFPYIVKILTGRRIACASGVIFGVYYLALVEIGRSVESMGTKYILVGLASFVSGMVVSLLSTYVNATFLKVVQPDYIARTAAIMNATGSSAIPVASFLIGIVSSRFTVGGIFSFVGVLLIIVMVVVSFSLNIEYEKQGV